MPSGISPWGRRTPRRRASAWRTSSWIARGRRGRTGTACCARRRPRRCRDARLALEDNPDSAEAAVAVARALAQAPEGDAAWLGRNERELSLGVLLLYRGHVREGAKILFGNPAALPLHLTEAALVSSSLPDSAEWRAARDARRRPPHGPRTTLPLWAARGDSMTIRRIERTADSVARVTPNPVNRGIVRFAAEAAPAYLALVRHDTAAAVRILESLPDSLCALCYIQRMTLAQLLAARQEDQQAAKLLDQWLIDLTVPSGVLWTLERGAGGRADGESGEGGPVVPVRGQRVAARRSRAAAVRGGGAGGIGEDDQRAEVIEGAHGHGRGSTTGAPSLAVRRASARRHEPEAPRWIRTEDDGTAAATCGPTSESSRASGAPDDPPRRSRRTAVVPAGSKVVPPDLTGETSRAVNRCRPSAGAQVRSGTARSSTAPFGRRIARAAVVSVGGRGVVAGAGAGAGAGAAGGRRGGARAGSAGGAGGTLPGCAVGRGGREHGHRRRLALEHAELVEAGDQAAQRGDEARRGREHAGKRLVPGVLLFVGQPVSSRCSPARMGPGRDGGCEQARSAGSAADREGRVEINPERAGGAGPGDPGGTDIAASSVIVA